MTSLAILLAGYSLFSAIAIALTHFRHEQYPDQPVSRVMGLILLAALAGLQLAHFSWLYHDQEWVHTIPYRMVLFVVAPAFFLFSQPLLRPQRPSSFDASSSLHAFPVLLSPLIPDGLGMPIAFMVGAGYLIWLAQTLIALRHERTNFRLEIILLGSVFAIAIGVSALGLAHTTLPDTLFFSLYATAIGLAFMLVQITLGLRPRLPSEVREAVQTAYSTSTLNNIDCGAKLERLNSLMTNNRIFADPELRLPGLAAQLDLSAHQLSELLNARLGKSFARYLREQRVAASKSMLCDEPSASVLAVGLSVGFTSQSTFYEAFRDIEGMTPGQYRKLQGNTASSRAITAR